VSEKIVEVAGSLPSQVSPASRSWLGNYLIRGRDGQYFVNYLFDDHIASEQVDTTAKGGTYSGSLDPVPQPAMSTVLETHRAAVVEGLFDNQSNPRVYEKYLWTASYHNFFCRRYGYEQEVLQQPNERYEFLKLGDEFADTV
jgi:hypothetical protein